MKLEYKFQLKEGYRPTCELEKENTARIMVEVPCRADADKMMNAVLQGCTNIENLSTVENMQFEYIFHLKEGYSPTCELEKENTAKITVEAPCRVDADRMMSAILQGSANIEDSSAVSID